MSAVQHITSTELDAMALGALARDCRLAGVERQVLLVRLSLIPHDYYQPHHGRLAESALDPLAGADRARLYRLPGHDLAMAWRGDAAPQERRVLATLSVLFAEPAPSLPSFADLIRRFTVPGDADRLAACLAVPESAPMAAPARPPLDLAGLGAIERALASADVSRFARRRAIARRDGSGQFRLAWEKRFLSVTEIGETLAPGYDISADPWLFRRLTRTLDRRMLAMLGAPRELASAPPFAIDLSVESILSPAFLAFDAALPAALRGQVVLELLSTDILHDPPAFLFARGFVQGRGYRIALAAAEPQLLAALRHDDLGLDFLSVRYSSELCSLDEAALDAIVGPRERVVLTGTDTPAALVWGEAQGIQLFQGRNATPAW